MDVLKRLEVVQSPVRDRLADRVVVILKRLILVENLKPGARMPPERRLADVLNVSRTVLREALSLMIGEGVLVRSASRTIEVGEYDREALVAELSPLDSQGMDSTNLMELRYVLEVGAIPLVVDRLTPETLAELEHWATESEQRLAAGYSGITADINFHMSLLRALNNPAIDSLVPLIEEQIREYLVLEPRLLVGGSSKGAQRVTREHWEVVAAIKAGDANRAIEVMRQHLSPYLAAIRHGGRGRGPGGEHPPGHQRDVQPAPAPDEVN